MENIEYANACSEVLGILKFLSNEDYNKIPTDVIDNIKANSNEQYKFFYDSNKTLDEQNVTKRAKSIIAVLYKNYLATDEQKEKIENFQKQRLSEIEEEKREKYDIDVFKDKRNEIKENTENTENSTNEILLPIEVKEETFLQRIINKIKSFFRK